MTDELKDPWKMARSLAEDMKLRDHSHEEMELLRNAGWEPTTDGEYMIHKLANGEIDVWAKYFPLDGRFEVTVWTTRRQFLTFATAQEVILWRFNVERQFADMNEED